MSASYILFSQQHPFARAWDSFPGGGSRPPSSVSRRSSVKLNWRILSGNEIIEGRNDDSCSFLDWRARKDWFIRSYTLGMDVVVSGSKDRWRRLVI